MIDETEGTINIDAQDNYINYSDEFNNYCISLESELGIEFQKDRYGLGVDNSVLPPWYNRLPSLKQTNNYNVYNISPKTKVPITYEIKKTSMKYFNHQYGRTGHESTVIHAVFTYTEHNYICGYLLIDGSIQLFMNVSRMWHNVCSMNTDRVDEFKSIIKKMFEFTYHIKQAYFKSHKMNNITRDNMILSILSSITRAIPSKSDYQLNEAEYQKTIYKLIKDKVEYILNQPININHTNILYNYNLLYKRALSNIREHSEKMLETEFHKGMSIGTIVFSSLIQSGYIPSDGGQLSKELDIVPQFCIHENKYYKIAEEDQIYYVNKISFDPNIISRTQTFVLVADANHPNIHSGNNQICVGSENNILYKKLVQGRNTDPQDLVDLFMEIEETMKVINFDSSYVDYHKGMNDRWTKVEVNSSTKRSTKSVRRI